MTVILLVGSGVFAPARGGRAEAQYRGKWVAVRLPLSRTVPRVRYFVTAAEMNVVASVQTMITSVPTVTPGDEGPPGVDWIVEPTLERSAMANLQQTVMRQVASIVMGTGGFDTSWKTTVVVARTQEFIRQSLERLGCNPDLSRTGGTFMMGATICGRHVVVSNLTGFLFLGSAGQAVTREMESTREPLPGRIPYRYLLRTAGGLAHEFVHVWRAADLKGRVRGDEPLWFSEGLAEFWSGVGLVRTIGPHSYLDHHVLRVRDFADWKTRCTGRLADYRAPSPLSDGCEYHLGLMAVEYLYSTRAHLAATAGALMRAEVHPTFADWFASEFGIPVDQFEAEADAYIKAVRRAPGPRPGPGN